MVSKQKPEIPENNDDDLPELPDDESDDLGLMQLEKFADLPETEESVPEQVRPVLEDSRTMRKYQVPTYPMFIGRDKKNAICILESAVSRRHTKVFERDNMFYVQDMGSMNGTYLNDKRILDPVALKEGDRIKIAITKVFPRGVREFVFHTVDTAAVAKEQKEQSEREAVLKQAGIIGEKMDSERRKIMLRHCVFKVARNDLMTVLMTETPRRVAVTKLDLATKVLSFQALLPFKIKDNLSLSVEHPRLGDALRISVRVVNIVAMSSYGIYEHQNEILKISDKHKQIYDTTIKASPMICYLTSQFKE
jgi:pSer/pThr/pTyr-binding forkhead associated (FHA) protein